MTEAIAYEQISPGIHQRLDAWGARLSYLIVAAQTGSKEAGNPEDYVIEWGPPEPVDEDAQRKAFIAAMNLFTTPAKPAKVAG